MEASPHHLTRLIDWMFPALGILSMVIVTFFSPTPPAGFEPIDVVVTIRIGPTRNGALGQPTRPISQTTTVLTLLAI